MLLENGACPDAAGREGVSWSRFLRKEMKFFNHKIYMKTVVIEV